MFASLYLTLSIVILLYNALIDYTEDYVFADEDSFIKEVAIKLKINYLITIIKQIMNYFRSKT